MPQVDPSHTGAAAPPTPAWGVEPFGKYHLVRKLAEGGMAEIFLAKHVGPEGFERDVVIKRMLSELSSNSEFVTMFLDEARLAARLSHHNIVQIHDLGQESGHYFICMEYLPGEDFSTILRGAARKKEFVPLSIVTRIVLEAAAGLHYAHEFTDASGKPMQVVHRDVSPSNVFVTFQGHTKLLDFGIAKAESRVSRTTAGTVKGKYMYMAPEQARGKTADRRVDVFALGINLYEALTRTRPFARETTLQIIEALSKGEFKAPRQIRPSIPEPLEKVILKAMAPELPDRYQTAKELAADLERAMAGNIASTAQVAEYACALFGKERVELKTRVPSLASLLKEGGASLDALKPPPLTDAGPGGPGTPGLKTPPRRSGEKKPEPTTSPTHAGRTPMARHAAGIAVGVAALLLIGAATAYAVWSGADGPQPPAAAPVAAVAPPRPSVLRVESEPAGARILVDGQERGTSPLTVEALAAGKHRVTASMEGYAPVEQTVTIGGPGERTNLVLALTAAATPASGTEPPADAKAAEARKKAAAVARGKLSLDTEPWTLVYLGKRKLGETPLVDVALPAGTHVLRLVNESKQIDEQVEIEIKAGRSTAKKLRF